jgi:crossover junction endodeoxyribonuclease RuvC
MSGLAAGIDIGATGGAALLDGRDLREVEDLPSLPDGMKGRLAINGALLSLLIRKWSPTVAFVEYVASRPTDSRPSAFSFGRARGCVEGVLAAHSIPIVWLTVPLWRRTVGLPPGATKDHARGKAIQLWPAFADRFARVCDADRAEAALIAVAGLMRKGGGA